jgi:hypothetical protein
MRALIERLETLTEETKLGKGDQKTIDAFLDKKKADSKKLSTDGKRLDGNWMGGRGIAEWKSGKIVFHDLGSKAAQTVQRAIKKKAPRNWLDEEFDLEEAKKMTRKEAYEQLKKTKALSTAMLKPLGISFETFLSQNKFSPETVKRAIDGLIKILDKEFEGK